MFTAVLVIIILGILAYFHYAIVRSTVQAELAKVSAGTDIGIKAAYSKAKAEFDKLLAEAKAKL